MKFRYLIVAIGVALILGGIALGAEKTATPSVSHTLLRSGAALDTYTSRQACVEARETQRQADAPTKTSGQTRYVCREDDAITVTYGPPTAPVNRPPTISGTLPNGRVGGEYYFLPTASDPEGGVLTFSIANAPGWMRFRTSDGRIVGEPAAAGVHANIVVSVRDAAGNVASLPPATVTITGGSTPTPVNCTVSAWSDWSGGAWSSCANGQQTRTETRTRTVTTQPANGGAACPALTETRTATQACSSSGSASLSWTPPTQNSDGSSLTNLAGYRISYGTNPDALVQTVQVANPGVRTYTIGNLAPGTWYFAVRAYTSTNESVNSNVGSKVIR